jgi:hypothetical protein
MELVVPNTISKKATRIAIQLSDLRQRRRAATAKHRIAEMIRSVTNMTA